MWRRKDSRSSLQSIGELKCKSSGLTLDEGCSTPDFLKRLWSTINLESPRWRVSITLSCKSFSVCIWESVVGAPHLWHCLGVVKIEWTRPREFVTFPTTCKFAWHEAQLYTGSTSGSYCPIEGRTSKTYHAQTALHEFADEYWELSVVTLPLLCHPPPLTNTNYNLPFSRLR